MKNKFVKTAILFTGLTLISPLTNHLSGQTKNSKNNMDQNMNSGTMNEKDMKMMNDSSKIEKDGKSDKSMNMKNDTARMEKNHMSHNSMDMNSDKMKMKNDTAMMKKEKM